MKELVKCLVALTVGVVAFFNLEYYDDIRLTGTTLAAVSGTLTGFIMTALSMLIAIADRPFITKLRKTKHYQVLLRNGFTSAGLWLSVLVVALTSHFAVGVTQRAVLSVAIALFVIAIWYFVASGIRFSRVLLKLSTN